MNGLIFSSEIIKMLPFITELHLHSAHDWQLGAGLICWLCPLIGCWAQRKCALRERERRKRRRKANSSVWGRGGGPRSPEEDEGFSCRRKRRRKRRSTAEEEEKGLCQIQGGSGETFLLCLPTFILLPLPHSLSPSDCVGVLACPSLPLSPPLRRPLGFGRCWCVSFVTRLFAVQGFSSPPLRVGMRLSGWSRRRIAVVTAWPDRRDRAESGFD